eukprot:EG_transcript_7516
MEKMAPEATDEDSKQSWTTPFDGPLHHENTSMSVGLLETADAEVAIEMDGAGGEEGTETQSEAASHAPRSGPSAMERAGWFSRLTFSFMGPIIRTGAKRPLQLWDIDEPPNSVKAARTLHTFREHWAVECQKPKPKLYKSLLVSLKADLLFVMACGIAYAGCPFVTPFLLQSLLEVVQGTRPQWEGFLYAAIIYAVNIIGGALQSHILARMQVVALKVRTSLNGAIYQKALRLSPDAWKTTTTGKVFNLVGQRVEQTFRTVTMLAYMSYVPILTLLALSYMGYVVGLAAVGGVVILVTACAINYQISSSFRGILTQKFGLADKRLTIMNQLVQAMRVVKLYAWEPSFLKNILELRIPEVMKARQMNIQMSRLMFCRNLGPSIFQLVVFIIYAFSTSTTSAGVIFTTIALLNMIRQAFSMFPMSLNAYHTLRNTLEEITVYLLLPEVERRAPSEAGPGRVELRDGTMRWGKDTEPILRDVNFVAEPGELVMVVGKVGSGKTTLLNAILQEGEWEGSFSLAGTVAYVPQQAWILNDTLRANVLFGTELTPAYEAVVTAVDLAVDMANLPDGDLTEIGEKG